MLKWALLVLRVPCAMLFSGFLINDNPLIYNFGQLPVLETELIGELVEQIIRFIRNQKPRANIV